MKERTGEEINLLLKQLRESLKDILPGEEVFDNNAYLYYWLQNHQMKVERTSNAVRKSIEWRKSVNLDELAEGEWAFFAPGLEKEISLHFEGYSKAGLPISTTKGEGIDGHALLRKYGKQVLLRYFIQGLAKVEKNMVEHFRDIHIHNIGFNNNCCLNSDSKEITNPYLLPDYSPVWDTAATIHISSFRDLTLRNVTCIEGIQILLEGAKIGITYFPAVKGTLYLVNLNKFASVFLKMLKPVIAFCIFDLEVYDTDKTKWSKKLQEKIGAEQLQPYFGGTRVIKKK